MKMKEFKFEPVQKNSLVIELTKRLMDFIFSGSIKPGERLPAERQLSEALGVGRSSIREAIKALTVLGVLEVRQGDGTYLKKADSALLTQVIEWGLLLGEKQAMDLIEARKEIEVIIAGFAAERCSDEEIEELRAKLNKMNESDVNTFIDADVDFHLELAKIAKNGVLKDILVSIQSLLRIWIKSVIESAGDTRFSYHYHIDIFEAVARRDAEGARAAMKRHMDDAADRLIAVLEKAEKWKMAADDSNSESEEKKTGKDE
jgi:GntR family transcriptional repressor for pyruvate dehydrogenase complex